MIDFQNITKRFGTQTILENASFRINTGEHAGIVGPNGTGKSTIAAIIAREISPDSGTVTVPNNARIGYLRQQVDPNLQTLPLIEFTESGGHVLNTLEADIHNIENQLKDTTLKEDQKQNLLSQLGEHQTAFEHAGGYERRHRTEAALHGLGFRDRDFNLPLSTFSGGWQMRAALARALVSEPDILLLDEPSNYLDIPAVEWLQLFLKRYQGTLLLISHDRYLLNTLTQVTIEVANAATERYAGNFDQYRQERSTRVDSRIAAQRNAERKREKAEQFIERFRYKATKSSQVKSRIKMIERMESVDVPKAIISHGRITIPPAPRSGNDVMRLEQINFGYDSAHYILNQVDLRILRSEKLAIIGHNGMGKTTLLRIIAGMLTPQTGKRVQGHRVQCGYQSQEFTDTINPAHTVYETVKLIAPDQSEQNVRGLLGGFGFSGDAVEKKTEVLSGGEKVRLAFARLLINPPNLLLLDEPTTHLDIQAREGLEQALKNYDGTLVMVSHDVQFVEQVAQELILIDDKGVRRFNGNYRDYREWLANHPTDAPPKTQPTRTSPDCPTPTESRKEQRKAKAKARQERIKEVRMAEKTAKRAEAQIGVFEKEQARIIEQLQAPPDGFDYEETNRRLAWIQQEISAYTDRWSKAMEQLEELDIG